MLNRNAREYVPVEAIEFDSLKKDFNEKAKKKVKSKSIFEKSSNTLIVSERNKNQKASKKNSAKLPKSGQAGKKKKKQKSVLKAKIEKEKIRVWNDSHPDNRIDEPYTGEGWLVVKHRLRFSPQALGKIAVLQNLASMFMTNGVYTNSNDVYIKCKNRIQVRAELIKLISNIQPSLNDTNQQTQPTTTYKARCKTPTQPRPPYQSKTQSKTQPNTRNQLQAYTKYQAPTEPQAYNKYQAKGQYQMNTKGQYQTKYQAPNVMQTQDQIEYTTQCKDEVELQQLGTKQFRKVDGMNKLIQHKATSQEFIKCAQDQLYSSDDQQEWIVGESDSLQQYQHEELKMQGLELPVECTTEDGSNVEDFVCCVDSEDAEKMFWYYNWVPNGLYVCVGVVAVYGFPMQSFKGIIDYSKTYLKIDTVFKKPKFSYIVKEKDRLWKGFGSVGDVFVVYPDMEVAKKRVCEIEKLGKPMQCRLVQSGALFRKVMSVFSNVQQNVGVEIDSKKIVVHHLVQAGDIEDEDEKIEVEDELKTEMSKFDQSVKIEFEVQDELVNVVATFDDEKAADAALDYYHLGVFGGKVAQANKFHSTKYYCVAFTDMYRPDASSLDIQVAKNMLVATIKSLGDYSFTNDNAATGFNVYYASMETACKVVITLESTKKDRNWHVQLINPQMHQKLPIDIFSFDKFIKAKIPNAFERVPMREYAPHVRCSFSLSMLIDY